MKSYKDQLKDFNMLKEECALGKTGEQLISWYISNEPFGLYFAAKELWQKKDQRSKDRAISYYERFVKHQDIAEEGAEVKKAIKIVLKAYRYGYGDKKEQHIAAEAFEQAIVSKEFNVPKREKLVTKADDDRKRKWEFPNDILKQATAAGVITAVTWGIKKGAKVLKNLKPAQNDSFKQVFKQACKEVINYLKNRG